ncbi:hypothetical protein CFY87_05025 [Actinobacillus seminis]|uniref:YadA domain-containing protein n=1 Tax=Actinobacillus seminis TaxID=722 RepID=A0A263HEJ4_9PAST|nr:YadA-like family protein [Actinobacillus seminis]OZN25077.1 hypothetical protein CFY87_05025 [Actinobacillus seminis]SUU38925.1 YadA domain-containing protein [Actinobacillus seminis]
MIKAEPTDQAMKITNVKEGDLKAGSTDAVNAGQLFTATGMNPNPALSTEDALKKQQESAEKLSAAKKKYEELVKQKTNNKEELNKAIEGIFEAEKNDTPKYVFADGKDGQYGGKGKDGKTNNTGATGLTAKDGLNGLNPNDKANAIRNGEAGTLVYTNEKGERLVKGNDGKYYKAGDVRKDGLVRPNAEAQTAQLSLVNTNGESAGNAIALNNLKSALGLDDKKENAEQEKQEIEKLEKEIATAKADVKTKQQEAEKLKAELEKTQTPKGINGGVDTAKAGLNFKGNQGEMIHKALTETLEIVGFGREKDQKVFIGTENNIDVAGKDGKLVVTLNQDLKGMNTFETKDEDGKKSILDKSGLRVVDGSNIGIHNADGVHVGSKGNDGYLDPDQPKASFTKDGVEIVGKDKQTAKYGVDDIKLDDKKGNSVTIGRAGTTLKDDKGHTAGYKVDGATLKDKQGNESIQNANGLTVKDDKDHTATHAAASSTLHDGKGNTATHSAVATTLKDNEGNATTHTAKGSTVSNKEGDSAQYGANKVTMKDKNSKENVVIDAAKGTMQIGDKITLNGNKGHLTVPDVTPQTPGNAVVNKNYVDIKTNDLQNQLNVSNKELRAGVAAAMAMGSLYKPSLPGKSTLSVGVGTYKGENAVAVGYSKLSDNAKFGLNVSFSSNSVGDKGGAASIGYQW